jgi:hypothetical protein
VSIIATPVAPGAVSRGDALPEHAPERRQIHIATAFFARTTCSGVEHRVARGPSERQACGAMVGRLRAELLDFVGDDDVGALRWLVRSILVLNLLDAVLTLLWMHTGVATEANILLRDLAEHSALSFVSVKLALVSLGVLVLWHERRRPLAMFGLALAFAAYNAILLIHLGIAGIALEQALT